MTGSDALTARFEILARGILKLALDARRILIVTHLDADGLASGSIVFAALTRKGANAVLRCVPEIDQTLIGELAGQKYDFYIFTDLASTLIKELEAAFDGRFLVIDHHQTPEDDLNKPSVMNAWSFGFDGGREASSSTMAYFFATAVDPSNRDLSPLAVVGAVADRQDGGQGRSLTGLNRVAMEEARASGLLTVTKDLLFTGRETRPVHEAVALTSTPYLKGLTGSKDAVLAALHRSGIRLKDGASWRTISALSSDEKMKVTEVIASLVGASEDATSAISELIGEVYTLEFEDSFTPLRDAREFGTLLNACGRMGATGIGASICLGDRTESLKEAMKSLSEYRSGLNKALRDLSEDPSRTQVHGTLAIVRAEGIVDEKLLGPVISILTSSPGFTDKIVVGITASGESEMKVSSRVGDAHLGEVNLALIMKEAAEAVKGIGGGHSMAAGAKIPASEADAFSRLVAEKMAA